MIPHPNPHCGNSGEGVFFTYTLDVSNTKGSSDQASLTVNVGALPPNVIVFLIDDFGWADCGQNGAPDGSAFYETPRMDQLASEGLWFPHGYAACTVCSPSRFSLLTGQIPAFGQLTQWISGTSDSGKPLREAVWTKRMPLARNTISEVLDDAGYRTIHVGKWHLGQSGDAESDPLNQGFDINIGGNHVGTPPRYICMNPAPSNSTTWSTIPARPPTSPPPGPTSTPCCPTNSNKPSPRSNPTTRATHPRSPDCPRAARR